MSRGPRPTATDTNTSVVDEGAASDSEDEPISSSANPRLTQEPTNGCCYERRCPSPWPWQSSLRDGVPLKHEDNPTRDEVNVLIDESFWSYLNARFK